MILAADDMMPLTLFLVIRAAVPHLGAELKLLEDLIGDNNFVTEMTGLAGYCYTTITVCVLELHFFKNFRIFKFYYRRHTSTSPRVVSFKIYSFFVNIPKIIVLRL